MNQPEIFDAIANAFNNLAENHKLYDYWMQELYDVNGEFIMENWTEETVKLMEDDVMAINY